MSCLFARDADEKFKRCSVAGDRVILPAPLSNATSWIGNRRRFGARTRTSTLRPYSKREIRADSRAASTAGPSTASGSSTIRSRSPPDTSSRNVGDDMPDGLNLVVGQAHTWILRLAVQSPTESCMVYAPRSPCHLYVTFSFLRMSVSPCRHWTPTRSAARLRLVSRCIPWRWCIRDQRFGRQAPSASLAPRSSPATDG